MLKHLKPEGFLCASEEETFCFSYYYVGRVLLMLGKLQFELQKLVDKYVSFLGFSFTFFDIFSNEFSSV